MRMETQTERDSVKERHTSTSAQYAAAEQAMMEATHAAEHAMMEATHVAELDAQKQKLAAASAQHAAAAEETLQWMQATHATELDSENAAASAQYAAVEKALQQSMDEAKKELETAKKGMRQRLLIMRRRRWRCSRSWRPCKARTKRS